MGTVALAASAANPVLREQLGELARPILDMLVTLADRAAEGWSERWAVARDEVYAAVDDQTWSRSACAYAGAFASDDLDASVLLLPLEGFLPASGELLSNFPQTFSHVGLVNAAWRLARHDRTDNTEQKIGSEP